LVSRTAARFLQLKVWRNGQHVELPVQLSTPHQLVPVHSHDLKPHYFIYGGEHYFAAQHDVLAY
jgi:hypothetical protein